MTVFALATILLIGSSPQTEARSAIKGELVNVDIIANKIVVYHPEDDSLSVLQFDKNTSVWARGEFDSRNILTLKQVNQMIVENRKVGAVAIVKGKIVKREKRQVVKLEAIAVMVYVDNNVPEPEDEDQ